MIRSGTRGCCSCLTQRDSQEACQRAPVSLTARRPWRELQADEANWIWLLSVQAAQNAWRAHLADVIFRERATERFHNPAHRQLACSTRHKRKIGPRSCARPIESLGGNLNRMWIPKLQTNFDADLIAGAHQAHDSGTGQPGQTSHDTAFLGSPL